MNVFNALGNAQTGASNAASLMSAVADGMRQQAASIYTQLQSGNINDSNVAQNLSAQYTNFINTAAAIAKSALDQANGVTEQILQTHKGSIRLLGAS